MNYQADYFDVKTSYIEQYFWFQSESVSHYQRNNVFQYCGMKREEK